MVNIPLHPVLVHFPIALFVLEFVLLLFWAAKKDDAYRRFALFVFRMGFIFMIAAIYEGLEDAGGISNALKHAHVRNHFLAAASVLIVYTARAFYWYLGKQNPKNFQRVQIFGALLGNLCIVATGYFGGFLVYGR